MDSAISLITGNEGEWPQIWDPEGSGDEEISDRATHEHIPSEHDVMDVKETLLRFLPLELVDTILDDAEYWPVLMCHSQAVTPGSIAAISFPNHNASYCYYISPKIPDTCHLNASPFKVRKVVFRIRSHDQGWGGDPGLTGMCVRLQSVIRCKRHSCLPNGAIRLTLHFHDTEPYAGSWTWFEAAIIRGLGGDDFVNDTDSIARNRIQGSTVLPPRRDTAHDELKSNSTTGAIQVPHPFNGSRVWMLQRNLRANREETLHEIVWTDGDDEETKEDTNEVLDRSGRGLGYGFVRSLEPGDRIAVYVRAQVIIALSESCVIHHLTRFRLPYRSTLGGSTMFETSKYRYFTPCNE